MKAKNCNLDLSSIVLEVIKAPGDCLYRLRGKLALTKIIPPNECLLALHEVIPYWLTLKNNGYFKWQKNANTVITQCPSPDIAVAIGVIRESKNKAKRIRAKIVANRSDKCPKEYKKGNEILKKILKNREICLPALDILVPYILFLEACFRKQEKVKPVIVQCSYCKTPAKFKLSLRRKKS